MGYRTYYTLDAPQRSHTRVYRGLGDLTMDTIVEVGRETGGVDDGVGRKAWTMGLPSRRDCRETWRRLRGGDTIDASDLLRDEHSEFVGDEVLGDRGPLSDEAAKDLELREWKILKGGAK